MNPKKAVAAGQLCIDMTPVFHTAMNKKLSEILVPGTVTSVDGMNLSIGGSAYNVGAALTRLGIHTCLNGAVGDDEMGTILKKKLDGEGLISQLKILPTAGTSFSVILSAPGNDRIFLHYTGVNDEYGADDVDEAAVREAALLHFGYPPFLRRMYTHGGRELKAIFRRAKQAGVTTSLDMAMPDPSAESGKVDWLSILQEVLPYVDIFMPSIEETLYMVNRPLYTRYKDMAKGDDMISVLDTGILPQTAELLHQSGAKIVMLKCGCKGFYLSTRTIDGSFGRACPPNPVNWSNKQLMEGCYQVKQIVSTTGTGDATIAAFLASLLNECDIEEAASNASVVGALCVGARDAVSGVPRLKDVVKMKAQMKKQG